MADSIFDTISRNFLKWLMTIIAGLLVASMYGGFSFYTEWKADEASEDVEKQTLMFDSSEQKQDTKYHVEESVPILEQHLKVERDIDFQKQVLRELKQMRKIDTLNADQMYQIKEELKTIQAHH